MIRDFRKNEKRGSFELFSEMIIFINRRWKHEKGTSFENSKYDGLNLHIGNSRRSFS
jgi:hypothetical protein